MEHASQVVEQIIRPTGLLDPQIDVRPATGQVDDLYAEIVKTTGEGYRVLVTTLTKKMAESLTTYLGEMNVKVRYLHSDVQTMERQEIIRDLRLGVFDVLVGINLLRERGLTCRRSRSSPSSTRTKRASCAARSA